MQPYIYNVLGNISTAKNRVYILNFCSKTRMLPQCQLILKCNFLDTLQGKWQVRNRKVYGGTEGIFLVSHIYWELLFRFNSGIYHARHMNMGEFVKFIGKCLKDNSQ